MTKLIGLTGGIGMGKSTAAELLRQMGVAMVDTDDLAREVVGPGQPALAEIRERFGHEIIGADGRLRREEMARLVFTDTQAREDLGKILHPRIRALWLAQADVWREQEIPVGVVVIPLLFEKNAAAHFGAVVCVACSAANQQKRLCARGWSDEQIRHRMESQWPIEKKIALADFVIWTDGSLDAHEQQLRLVLQTINQTKTSN